MTDRVQPQVVGAAISLRKSELLILVILPSSALAPASALAELVLVPNNPGRLTDRPTTIRNSTFHQLSSKTQKTKVISLYEETPKQFLNPTPTLKFAH